MSVPSLTELPTWGRRVDFDGFFVELVPQGERTFNVRLRETFASINFGPAEGTSSLAGDRLRRYERRPFEWIVVPPRFPLRGSTEAAPEVLVFVFNFELIRESLTAITETPPEEIHPQVVIGSPAPFATALAKQIRSHLATEPLCRRYLNALCTVLMIEMCRPMSARRGRQRRSPLGDDKMNMLLKYIDANLDSDLAAPALSKIVGASSHQLARAFKRTIGDSPHHYVLQRRVDAAREMLKRRDVSLADIAYACGFSSQSHMTTAFRKVLGITPGSLRSA